MNNATKTLKIGNETYVETVGKQIPNNVVALLQEKAALHSTQAFLMENMNIEGETGLIDVKEVGFLNISTYV